MLANNGKPRSLKSGEDEVKALKYLCSRISYEIEIDGKERNLSVVLCREFLPNTYICISKHYFIRSYPFLPLKFQSNPNKHEYIAGYVQEMSRNN